MSQLPPPLSPIVESEPFFFVSGQLGIDAIGQLVGNDVTSQTRQTLENVRSLLVSKGLDMADVVKTTVFLTDMADFQAMNVVYREFFQAPFPARSTIGAALVRPAFLVEIEVVARRRS